VTHSYKRDRRKRTRFGSATFATETRWPARARKSATKIASVKSTQEDHQGDGDGRGEQDAPRPGPHALARPYAEKIRTRDRPPDQANPDYRHPFMVTREPKNVGIIVISTDRGLCGGAERQRVQDHAEPDEGMAGQGRGREACA
jgi:F-type H+-transporting ATPase subunit gamma